MATNAFLCALLAGTLSFGTLSAQALIGTAISANRLPAKTAFTGCATGAEAPTAADAAAETDVLLQVNAYRRLNALAPLKRSTDLIRAARYHALDMATDGYFQHETYDCADPNLFDATPPPCAQECSAFDRMEAFYAWTSASENIAFNYPTADDVMDAWKNSTNHNANILSSTERELGVGLQEDGSGTPFWVQNFGARSGVYPLIINHDSLQTTNPNVEVYLHRPSSQYTEFRLSTDGSTWTPWQPYPATGYTFFTLSPVSPGVRQVFSEVRQGAAPQNIVASEDDIELVQPSSRLATQRPRLALWPNPTQGFVTLNLTQPDTARVFDALGRCVLHTAVPAGTARLDLATLPAGVYTLQLSTGATAQIILCPLP